MPVESLSSSLCHPEAGVLLPAEGSLHSHPPAHRRAGEGAADSPANSILAAIEARLGILEQEIDRLARLASEAGDVPQRQQYWDLAQDLQREARKIRDEIRRMRACAQDK